MKPRNRTSRYNALLFSREVSQEFVNLSDIEMFVAGELVYSGMTVDEIQRNLPFDYFVKRSPRVIERAFLEYDVNPTSWKGGDSPIVSPQDLVRYIEEHKDYQGVLVEEELVRDVDGVDPNF